MRRALVVLGLILAASLFALAGAEVVARVLEPAVTAEGDTRVQPDPVIGWLPRPGVLKATTSEFSATYDVNSLAMDDRPVGPSDAELPVRVLALGDSHTFAIGVSRDEAWPLVLDRTLFASSPSRGRVFNGGVAAYSLGQYLQRFRMLQPAIRPQLVLVGVSTATDLFDLLPPRLGGFVYGGNTARVYFDLDDQGQLVERTFVPQATVAAPARATGLRLRESLRQLALYRRFQTSLIAMRLATTIRLPGSDPIWAGPDVVLHRELNAREQFQWALATAIIRRLVQEERASGGTVALVVIPYLPEVYDDIWNATFGRSPAYDRFIGARRLETIATDAGAAFIDTTPALVAEVRRSHGSLHYRIDKHPTAAGQRVIAGAVATFIHSHPALLNIARK
jgi:lysophospholipase L1-like esterase